MTDRNLTEGSVAKALIVVSAPMTLGVLSIMLTGLADAFFLGRYGQTELAAIGFIYPVTITITSLSIGLSAGVNSVVSRALGENRDTPQTRMAFHCLLVAAAIGISLAALLSFTYTWIFSAMGADDRVLAAAGEYFVHWRTSFPFLVVTMATGAVIRAHGDGTRPAMVMAFEAAINVLLTPALVFGVLFLPEMGAGGAGLATLIARLLSFAAGLTLLFRLGLIRTSETSLSGLFGSALPVLRVALPAAGSNAINPAGLALVTAVVAGFGEAAVAGFGAAGRIQSFLLVPMLALSAGIGPVIGQNWGAGAEHRCHRALFYALGICVAYGTAGALVLTVLADTLADAMTKGSEAAAYMAQYLRIVGWSLFGYGFVVVINAAMNARDKAGHSLSLSLARIGLVYVPLAWLLSSMFDFTGVLIAAVVANVAGAALALALATRTGLLPGIGAVRARVSSA